MRAVGIDIGSSTIKSCFFEGLGDEVRLLSQESVACGLLRHGDEVDHDLAEMTRILRDLLSRIPGEVPVGFSSAMHALVILDRDGEPLGNALSWAHTAAKAEARTLADVLPEARERTGTPVHPMGWPSKLLWLKNQRPDLWKRATSFTDLKSYVLSRALDVSAPVDLSNASATGLWNQIDGCWDQELLEYLNVSPDQLPNVENGMSLRERAGRMIALGAGDGPISNLGVGAVTPLRLALSVGTSAAVRRVVGSLETGPPGLFRYQLGPHTFAMGGALSNGTSVLDWMQKNSSRDLASLTQAAWDAPAGAHGVRVYPYFSGERYPWWKSDVPSTIAGWGFQQDWGHLTRAALEGVAYCLRRLTDEVACPEAEPIRCTGGLFADANWARLLADVMGRPIALSPIAEAGALGAALCTSDRALEWSESLPLGTVVEPEEKRAALYEDLYQEWRQGHPAV